LKQSVPVDERAAKVRRYYEALKEERERRRAEAARFIWEDKARPEQVEPPGDWRYWLILAGRGFGKTRTGAEWVRKQVKTNRYITIAGATHNDARTIMIEGESGILAVCPRAERPDYRGHRGELHWPNGAVTQVLSAEEPERFRGKQHEKLWVDELAAWRYPEAWDQAVFGLRLGSNPRALITTTPRPTAIMRDLIANPHTFVTRGSTYDNRANLAPEFFDAIIRKYEGTRFGRQELHAEMLDDNPDGVFRRVYEAIDHALPLDATTWRSDGSPAYVIGVDWGRHHDYTVFIVMDSRIKSVVAIDRFTDIDYAIQMTRLKALHARFPKAQILAEANSIGEPIIEALRRDGLPVRDFYTTSASKATVIEDLAMAFEKNEIRVPNHDTLIRELLDYTQDRLPSGSMRYGAPSGVHDDCVMALAIAWHGVGFAMIPPKVVGTRVFT
jgi:phage terminase large subunit-like protein